MLLIILNLVNVTTDHKHGHSNITIWSLSRYCADCMLPLLMVSKFPLLAEDIQSCEGNTANGGHQKQPDEELAKDRIFCHH